jgi:uncharacterized protein YyaL (SSP411 family)
VDENGNVAPEHDAHDELMNQNVLAVRSEPDALAKEFGLPQEQVEQVLEDARRTLRGHREKERPRPALDDKVVLAWNGLAIGALARTSAALEGLDEEKYRAEITRFRDAAVKAVEFLRREMRDDKTGHMKRVWREGPGAAPAFADDYAFLIGGLIDLYEATWDDGYLKWADELQSECFNLAFDGEEANDVPSEIQLDLFWDEAHGGFFATAANQPDLILRLKDGMDSTEPSTNGFSTRNLFRLASILDGDSYADRARRTLHAFEAEVMQYPYLFVGMLDSVVSERVGVKGIVITGAGDAVEKELKKLRVTPGIARTVVRLGAGMKDEWIRGRSELLKAMNPEKPGVQVCENGVCREILKPDGEEA